MLVDLLRAAWEFTATSPAMVATPLVAALVVTYVNTPTEEA